MSAMITPELVVLDKSLGNDRAGVIRRLAELVVAQGRADQVEGLFADALAREEKTATGIPGGIAIPHCRSTAVLEPTLAMARLEPKVDFGAKDGPADLVFFIAAPEGADQQHLKLLSKLARSLIKKDFTAALRAASSEQEIVALVEEALDAGPAKKDGGATSVDPESADPGTTTPPVAARTKRLVAVTACPTGIAHTYMAADSLVAAAKERGIDLQVETQGSSASTPLDPSVIAAADAVIFAVDVDVRDKHRFAGKPVINAPVKRGIDEPGVMVEEALAAADNPNARRVADSSTPGTHDDESGSESIGG
ncbi:MAG: fructose PTS transporter subunit IIA, partial [Actinomycetes bacterium]